MKIVNKKRIPSIHIYEEDGYIVIIPDKSCGVFTFLHKDIVLEVKEAESFLKVLGQVIDKAKSKNSIEAEQE